MKNKRMLLGSILIILAGIMWGHTGYFVHVQSGYGISETGIAILRLCIAFVFMAIYMFIFHRSKLRIPKKAFLFAALAGVIGMVTCSVVYFYAINMTSTSVATVLMYTSPAIVVVISFFLYGEKITLKKALCLILAFVGAVLVANLIGGNAHYSPLGLLFGLIVGICYALYSIFAGHSMKCGATPEAELFYALGFASVTVLVYGFATEAAMPTFEIVTHNTKPMLWALFQGTFDCMFPYVLYTIGMHYTGASKASIMSTMELVMAAIIGAVSLGDKLGVLGYIGMALVIISVVLLNIGDDETAEKAEETLTEKEKAYVQ